MKRLLVLVLVLVFSSLGLLVFLRQGEFALSGSIFFDDSTYPSIGRDTKEFFKNGKYQILRGPNFYDLHDYSKNKKVLAGSLVNYDWSYFENEVYLIGQDLKKPGGFIYYIFTPDSGEIHSYTEWKTIPEKFKNNFKNLEFEINQGSRWNFRLHPAFRR